MRKNMIIRALIVLPMVFMAVNAQDVDAIEAARQAKAAAEKAAADAADATEAAIEQAASKAAKEARENAKRKKEEDAARKVAEEAAAEEAELDATAAAAGAEAKRKMAEELGVEVEVEETAAEETTVAEGEEAAEEGEEFVVKEKSGFSLGIAPSFGAVSGATFTSTPVGATVVLTTPVGFNLGPFDYTVSLAFGGYSGKYESDKADDDDRVGVVNEFNPTVVGLGGNLTLLKLVFAEGHVGLVGEGTGFRGFAGISLEWIMKKGLNLPVNVLVGSELFYSTDMAGVGNPSGWISLGARLDYGF